MLSSSSPTPSIDKATGPRVSSPPARASERRLTTRVSFYVQWRSPTSSIRCLDTFSWWVWRTMLFVSTIKGLDDGYVWEVWVSGKCTQGVRLNYSEKGFWVLEMWKQGGSL
ncbi:hypothetical protein YC2023_070102 [Brassica napus]